MSEYGKGGSFQSATTVVVSLAIAFIIIEIVLATTHLFGAHKSWTQPDALLGWSYTPGKMFWYDEENDHSVNEPINNHGWRDRDRELAKKPGTFRIAVLGDSFVEAFQVERDSTFAAILERDLNARLDRPVEVLNFGRSGMAQTEERLMLENVVPAYDPDLVIVVFLPINDIDDISPHTAGDVLRPFYRVSDDNALELDTSFLHSPQYRIKEIINPLKQNSAFVSFVISRYQLIRETRRAAALKHEEARRHAGEAEEHVTGALSLCTATPDSVYAANYALCRRLIEEMAVDWKGRMMLVCTDWVYRREDIRRWSGVDDTFDARFFERDLAKLSKQLGIRYVGLQTPFEDYNEGTGRALHWKHWNYEGHRLVADILADRLAPIVAAK